MGKVYETTIILKYVSRGIGSGFWWFWLLRWCLGVIDKIPVVVPKFTPLQPTFLKCLEF